MLYMMVTPKGKVTSIHPKNTLRRGHTCQLIPFDGTEEQGTALISECNYVDGKFVYRDTGKEFIKDAVVSDKDAIVRTESSETLATTLSATWKTEEPDVCKFLHPTHHKDKDFSSMRKYFYKRFRELAHLEGMRQFIACALYRDYGDISECGHNLPIATRTAVFESDLFSQEDKDWLKWLWRV